MPPFEFGSFRDDEEDFNTRLESIMGELRTRGYDVRARKRRTADEQRELYKYGRSAEKPGPIRTERSGEPGNESEHQAGRAADLDFFDREGRLVKSGEYPGFKEAGKLGEEWGLEWGGRWKKEGPDDVGPDPAHLQMIELKKLRAKKGNLGLESPTARTEERLTDPTPPADDKFTRMYDAGELPEGARPVMSLGHAFSARNRRTKDIELPPMKPAGEPSDRFEPDPRFSGPFRRQRLGDIDLPPEGQSKTPLGPEEAPKFDLDPRYRDALPKTRRLGTLPKNLDLPDMPDLNTNDTRFDMNPPPMEFGASAKRGNINLPAQDHTKYPLPEPKLAALDDNLFRDPDRQIRESTDIQPIPGAKGSPRFWVITNPRTGEKYNWLHDTPPTQEQAEDFIYEKLNQSFWGKIEAPLTEYPSLAARKLTSGYPIDPRMPFSGALQKVQDWSTPQGDETSNLVRGTTETIGDIGSALTSPSSIATTAASLGTMGAAGAGWGATARGFNWLERGLGAAQVGHGGYRMGRGAMEGDAGQIGAGALEAGFGTLGMMSRVPKGPPPPGNLGPRIQDGLVPYTGPRGGGIGDIVEGEIIHPGADTLGPGNQKLLPPIGGTYEPPTTPPGPPRLSPYGGQRVEPPSGNTYFAGKYGTGTDLPTVSETYAPPAIPPIEAPPSVPGVRGRPAMRNPTTGLSRMSDADLEFAARTGDKAAALEIRNRAKIAAAARREAALRGADEITTGGLADEVVEAAPVPARIPDIEEPVESDAIKGLKGKLQASFDKIDNIRKETDANVKFMAEQGDKDFIQELARRRKGAGRWSGETGAVGRGTRITRLQQKKKELEHDLKKAVGEASQNRVRQRMDANDQDIADEMKSLERGKRNSLRSSIRRYDNSISAAERRGDNVRRGELVKQRQVLMEELDNVGKTMTKAGNPANPDDNEIVALFRENLVKAQGYQDARFILPDGLKVTHYDSIHDSAARSIGTDLDEALKNGVVRFANNGVEIGSPITSRQAEEIADAAYYNDYGGITVDVRKAGGRYYEHKEIKRGDSPEEFRQWVKKIYENEPPVIPAKDNLRRVGVPDTLIDRYTTQEADDVVRGLTATGKPFHEMAETADRMAIRARERMTYGEDLREAVANAVASISSDFIPRVTSEGQTVRNQLKDFLEDILTWATPRTGGGERGATNLSFLTGGLADKVSDLKDAWKNRPKGQSRINPAKGTAFESEFAKWVNKKASARVEAVLEAEKFESMKDLGKAGVKSFADGSRTGKFQQVENFFSKKAREMEAANVSPRGARHLTEIFDNTPEEIDAAYKKLGRKTQYSLGSMLREIHYGTDAGLKPKFESVPHMVEWYGEKVDRMIANKKARDLFKDKGWVKLKGEGDSSDWQDLPNTLFPPASIQGKSRSWVASPEFATLIKNHLGEEASFPKFMGDIASTSKNLALSAGVPNTGINAHGANIMARSLMANLTSNPKRLLQHGKYLLRPKTALKDLNAMKPRMSEAVQDGLTLTTEGYTFGAEGGSGELLRGMGVKPGGRIDRAVTQTGKWFEDPLFQEVIPAIKMKHYTDMKDDLIKQGMARANAGKQAADFTNELYGGVNWQAMGRSKDMQNIGRATILAPDWLETNLRLGKGSLSSLKNYNTPEGKQYHTLIKGLGASYLAANMINLATTGHIMAQNEPGHTLDIELPFFAPKGKKRWIRPFGTAADFVRLPVDAAAAALGISAGPKGGVDFGQTSEIIGNRVSIPGAAIKNLVNKRDRFGRPILGQDDYGRPIPGLDQITNAGLEATSLITPPYVKGLVDLGRGKVGPEEAILGGFEIAPFRYSSAGKPEQRSTTRKRRPTRSSR
jgi:uncharacterized protein (UPF0335 family)